jgi:hypothetical protein
MANVVKLKRSAVQGKIPTTEQLELGEVALNTTDGALFFKQVDTEDAASIVEVATTAKNQTLTNKSFGDDVDISGSLTVGDSDSLGNITATGDASIGGDLTVTGSLIMATNAENIDLSSGAGIVDDQGSDGATNQILISTGSGVRWADNSAGSLSGLNDVSFSSLEINQILKYNGTLWVNADENAVVSSAVFAANALSDLGFVTDAAITIEEDLEPEHDIETQPNGLGDTDTYYNMGPISIDGVVGLRNVDQSLKSDYISYSIIFGF